MGKKSERVLLSLDDSRLAGARGGCGFPYTQGYGGDPAGYGSGSGLGGSAYAANSNRNDNTNWINVQTPEDEHRGLLDLLF